MMGSADIEKCSPYPKFGLGHCPWKFYNFMVGLWKGKCSPYLKWKLSVTRLLCSHVTATFAATQYQHNATAQTIGLSGDTMSIIIGVRVPNFLQTLHAILFVFFFELFYLNCISMLISAFSLVFNCTCFRLWCRISGFVPFS